MKQIKKHSAKISILFSLTFLIFSCSQYSDTNNESIQSDEKYSGEEIFTGLFFFQNEISDNISSVKSVKSNMENLSKPNAEVLNSIKEISELSVTYIKEKYPDFFDDFQKVLYSKNLYEIENALNTSVKMIEQATLASDKYSKAFRIGSDIKNNVELKNKILQLDLNNQNDAQEFKNLVSDIYGKENVGKQSAIFFAAVVAVAYIAVAAVSFVVGAYSVITKVAYWDVLKEDRYVDEERIDKEIMVAELSAFLTE